MMVDKKESYSGLSELADAEQGLLNYYSNIVRLIAKDSIHGNRNMSLGQGQAFYLNSCNRSLALKSIALRLITPY